MINQQLLDFIKSQLQLGLSKETITKELLSNDWTAEDVEEGFNAIKVPVPNPSNIPSPNLTPLGVQPLVMSNAVVQPQIQPQPQQPQIKYAGFWIRYVAMFIDRLVLIIPSAIIAILLRVLGVNIDLTLWINIYGLMVWIYFIFMTYKYQATLGKRAVGIKVFSDKGGKLTLGQIILRETVGKLLSSIILYIGYIMVGFTKRKQGLHDKVAGTIVVYNDPSKKMPKWIIIVIILLFALPFLAGIFSAIILSSLNIARNNADLKVKESLTSVMTEAISYSDKNLSFSDFKPTAEPISCSGDPIVNISQDGKQMAIFMKSCKDKTNYFCVNPATNFTEEIANADYAYVESGATVCYSETTTKETEVSTEEKTEPLAPGAGEIALVKTFKDDALGFEIKYPENWTYQKQQDKSTGATSVNFIPDIKSSDMNISISKFEFDTSPEVAKMIMLPALIALLQKNVVDMDGKVFDPTSFVYKFPDGTSLSGEQFESSYTYNNVNFKQWDVYFLNGKVLFWMRSLNNINEYDTQLGIAKAMIDAWIIKK